MNEGSGATSTKTPGHVRPGFNNIAPYMVVAGAPRFIEFLKAAFAGAERIQVPRPDGSIMHAEMGLGNSVIELADANEQFAARQMFVHLYVDDVDATFKRALDAGAKSIYGVEDQPWGDRQGCVKDEFGNVWYVATAKGWTPGPDGLLTVQPFLHLRNADKMIPFAEAAFRAETLNVAKSDDGKVLHGTIRIGKGTFEIDEANDEADVKPAYLHAYVSEVDEIYAEAMRAGAVSVEAPVDKSYGERACSVSDPFGNMWFLATYTGV